MDVGFKILQKETYLRMIENSIGTKQFSSIIVKRNGSDETEDILQNGNYSCAFFVSSLLTICRMLKEPRTTVKGVRENILSSPQWEEIYSEVSPGDIIFWEKVKFDNGSENEHVGFAFNSHEAISTSDKERMVVRHHITSGLNEAGQPKRKITAMFRYKFLDQNL